MIHGYVTDMLQIPFYPAIFNLADVAIRVSMIDADWILGVALECFQVCPFGWQCKVIPSRSLAGAQNG